MIQKMQPRHILSTLNSLTAATPLPRMHQTQNIVLTFACLVVPVRILRLMYYIPLGTGLWDTSSGTLDSFCNSTHLSAEYTQTTSKNNEVPYNKNVFNLKIILRRKDLKRKNKKNIENIEGEYFNCTWKTNWDCIHYSTSIEFSPTKCQVNLPSLWFSGRQKESLCSQKDADTVKIYNNLKIYIKS